MQAGKRKLGENMAFCWERYHLQRLCKTALIYRGKTDLVVTVSWKRSWIFNSVLIRVVEPLKVRGRMFANNLTLRYITLFYFFFPPKSKSPKSFFFLHLVPPLKKIFDFTRIHILLSLVSSFSFGRKNKKRRESYVLFRKKWKIIKIRIIVLKRFLFLFYIYYEWIIRVVKGGKSRQYKSLKLRGRNSVKISRIKFQKSKIQFSLVTSYLLYLVFPFKNSLFFSKNKRIR